jgi:hypothetical protein
MSIVGFSGVFVVADAPFDPLEEQRAGLWFEEHGMGEKVADGVDGDAASGSGSEGGALRTRFVRFGRRRLVHRGPQQIGAQLGKEGERGHDEARVTKPGVPGSGLAMIGPSSSLAVSKQVSIVQRKPATPASSASVVPSFVKQRYYTNSL